MPVLILAEDPSKDLLPVRIDEDQHLRVTNDIVLEATLSLDTSQYASGDVLAATQSLSGTAFLENGDAAIVQSIQVVDLDDQAGDLDIVLLRSNAAIGTENAAVSVTDANADEIVAIIEVTSSDYVDLVNSQIAHIANVGLMIQAASDDDGLWIAAISRDTKTYTASGLIVRIGLMR
jgi:hypothetical protein